MPYESPSAPINRHFAEPFDQTTSVVASAPRLPPSELVECAVYPTPFTALSGQPIGSHVYDISGYRYLMLVMRSVTTWTGPGVAMNGYLRAVIPDTGLVWNDPLLGAGYDQAFFGVIETVGAYYLAPLTTRAHAIVELFWIFDDLIDVDCIYDLYAIGGAKF